MRKLKRKFRPFFKCLGGAVMKSTGIIGGLYLACEWIMRFAATNVIWFLFNLPILLVILNLLSADRIGQVTFSYIAIVILIPFILFPSTTAMFAVVRKWVMKEEDIRIFQSYCKYYKENYVKSMAGGLIVGLFWLAACFYGYNLYLRIGASLMPMILIVFVLLFVFTLNFFSITVHFEVKIAASLKHAIFITIGRPFITLAIFVVSLLLLFLSLKVMTFLVPFATGSLIAYTSFLGFYTHLLKVKSVKKFTHNLNH